MRELSAMMSHQWNKWTNKKFVPQKSNNKHCKTPTLIAWFNLLSFCGGVDHTP